MTVKQLYEQLLDYISVMDLNEPLERESLTSFENTNNIKLPDSLIELLTCFNGGELFIPGTLVYGVNNDDEKKTIKYANRSDLRKLFDVPKTYLIIAHLNFGDLICINLNSPNDVIQWDHELNEEYCTWDSVEEWLHEEIESYKEFQGV